MKDKKEKGAPLIPRAIEKKLQTEGLKREHTHPEKCEPVPHQDPNGMTVKTLHEMKQKLKEVPKKSAATEHDKKAYE